MESKSFGCDEGVSLKQKLKSNTSETTMSCSDNGSFDCNICFESAHEPVVTLCGHLYCWPCIYKWLRVQSSSSGEQDQLPPACPVCKAEISHSSLVPLYGRGISDSDSGGKKLQRGMGIPHRPPPLNLNAMLRSPRGSIPHHAQHHLHPGYFQTQSRSFHYPQYFPHVYGGHGDNNDAAMTSFFNPMIGMFGGMVLTRIFGLSDASLFAYHYNRSGSPRMRRQEMQIDKSLNRVSIFLFCCIVLCLLLF